jgi:hypothetical protein
MPSIPDFSKDGHSPHPRARDQCRRRSLASERERAHPTFVGVAGLASAPLGTAVTGSIARIELHAKPIGDLFNEPGRAIWCLQGKAPSDALCSGMRPSSRDLVFDCSELLTGIGLPVPKLKSGCTSARRLPLPLSRPRPARKLSGPGRLPDAHD